MAFKIFERHCSVYVKKNHHSLGIICVRALTKDCSYRIPLAKVRFEIIVSAVCISLFMAANIEVLKFFTAIKKYLSALLFVFLRDTEVRKACNKFALEAINKLSV
jgi:hypothetical protein